VHILKDVAYDKNNITIQLLFFGAQGLHWMVRLGKYTTIGDNLPKYF